MPDSDLLRRFERHELPAAEFGHREHVQMAFEMLHKYGYTDTCARYSAALRAIAAAAGADDKFHVTITLAFLSVIAERIHADPTCTEFATFLARNEDLLARDLLARWYTHDELRSEFARSHFLLPTGAAHRSL